ncbi:MAG: MoaD/ThiS family protein, partial [Gammaproteobacteria bacterium]|nr:MoaD/ThiS family protein [Gammaproteobacteria bacterium]
VGARAGGAGAAEGAPGPVANASHSVGGVLGALSASHPGLYDRLMTEQGALRPHVNIFVDGENIRFTGGLGTRVGAGSEIFVLPAISGG